MQYIEFRQQLKDFIIFSLSDIRKIEPKFYRRRLNEWQDKGYIKKARRGYYIFADTKLDEQKLCLIANKIYSPSYVSLEMALSYYSLIPEGVYTVTSVSSRKTATFESPVGRFSYRSLKPELLFGYKLRPCGNQQYKLAEKEKAVLDFLYFHPGSTRPEDLQEWRFDGQGFLETADLNKFNRYAKAFNSPALEKRAKEFLDFIHLD